MEKTMTTKNYRFFADRFRGLNEGAKKALAKGYVLKNTSWTDPKWVEAYKEWLLATKGEFSDEGIEKFRTMSCYYWERVRKDSNDIIKKGWLDEAAEAQKEVFCRGINR